MNDSSSHLSPEIKALLQSRRAMFSATETPSILPDLHRRIRAAAMERTSLRQTLRTRLSEWTTPLVEALLDLNPAARLGYAGAFAAVALALFVGLQQSWKSGDAESAPLLTLNQPTEQVGSNSNGTAASDKVSYAMNDVNQAAAPISLDQKIDRVMANADDLSHDAVSAHYVMTRTPARYDSVVAF